MWLVPSSKPSGCYLLFDCAIYVSTGCSVGDPLSGSRVCSLTGGHTCHLIWALYDVATWHFVSNLLSFGALDTALTWVSVCFTIKSISVMVIVCMREGWCGWWWWSCACVHAGGQGSVLVVRGSSSSSPSPSPLLLSSVVHPHHLSVWPHCHPMGVGVVFAMALALGVASSLPSSPWHWPCMLCHHRLRHGRCVVAVITIAFSVEMSSSSLPWHWPLSLCCHHPMDIASCACGRASMGGKGRQSWSCA